MEEEFRKVQSEHRKILGELNLAVEAMLMPDSNSSQESSNEVEDNVGKQYVFNDIVVDDLTTGTHAVGADLDSGFSGSSGASYIGHLRMQKTNMRSRKQDVQNEEEQAFFPQPQPLFRHRTLMNFKCRQAEDISPFVKTESKARSFWNKKGWKRNSSIESIDRIGLEGRFDFYLFSFKFPALVDVFNKQGQTPYIGAIFCWVDFIFSWRVFEFVYIHLHTFIEKRDVIF